MASDNNIWYSSTLNLPTTPSNTTDVTRMLDDLAMDSNFAWLLCSLIFAISWIMYITYYNSRLTGYIITKIVNRLFISDGFFKIGSLTLNVLSGKIMFRDFVYITHDYTVRVQDGYLIFRWWRSYVPKDVSEDLSHSDTRLSVVLNGFELHVYNRGTVYARLERIFGLDPALFPNGAQQTTEEEEQAMNDENTDRQNSEQDNRRQRSEAAMARTWRDLIPVIKLDICSGRVVFGNRLVPTSLSITVEESHWVYSTKPAASTLDKLMHFVKCWAENARVMLAPSPKYTGMLDEPPRYMGEGFVLMATNYVELYAYMDEPGLVPDHPVLVRLANGDVVESSPPMWGIDIKCGKGTDFSYGPWADRQREHLLKFFYPADYQALKVTRSPKPGDKRQMHTLDIRLSMLNEATVDLLFSKDKETNAVHINVGPGSYLEITFPWLVLQNGCKTKINGQLLHLEATSSLQYRDLVSSETLEFSVNIHYPLIWNHHQLWELNLTGCKATVNLVYCHKNFFSDLINDWSSKKKPDLMSFVPYTWRFGLTLKHCEIIIPSNQYNWIDCSSSFGKKLENSRLALCSHLFHLSFDLPFNEFLPETVSLNFSIQSESIDLSIFIPENHTSRNIILGLDKFAKVLSKERKKNDIPKWRNVCSNNLGWVDFWWLPIGAISIVWNYHPVPPITIVKQADISTPVKEELLLSPIRFPHNKKKKCRSPENQKKFDPTTLISDKVTVELEIGPSVLLLFGTVLKNFVNLKENIFGDDQNFIDLFQNSCTNVSSEKNDEISNEEFDFRNFRPLEVDVSVIIHDIQAHLLKFCSESDPACPIILIERFGFEMKKRYHQTELQLLLSPSVLLVNDNICRNANDSSLQNGKMSLSSLQLRGHALFSDFERALDEDTIEYAWLLELQLGKLSGKLTLPQLHSIISSLEILIFLISDSENELSNPNLSIKYDASSKETQNQSSINTVSSISTAVRQLSTSGPQNSLQMLLNNKKIHSDTPTNKIDKTDKNPPTNITKNKEKVTTSQNSQKTDEKITDLNSCAHKLKYKFTRAAIDALDLWLVETGVALQLFVSPIRVANCNLHGKQVGSGLSCVIFNTMLRQLVSQNNTYKSRAPSSNQGEFESWLEVAAVNLGNLVIEAIISQNTLDNQLLQHRFLKQHDDKSRRLWFLWGGSKCGCIGGCTFFGCNRNGQKFFKPSKSDLQEGINIAAFKINEQGKDLGYGQSLLHENSLVFRTPPYTAAQILLYEIPPIHTSSTARATPSLGCQPRSGSPIVPNSASPLSNSDRKVNRRFSYTLTRNKDVPYSRLVEQPTLPAKLDSDSKLHTEKKGVLSVPDPETGPKNSVSDSKLAVDYFFESATPIIKNIESNHSINSEKIRNEVQRTTSMSSENHSDAFFSADEEINSRTSSLRHSIVGSGSVISPAEPQRKKFASDLSIVGGPMQISSCTTQSGSGPTSLQEGLKNRLSTHRSDHEIHTPEHRSFGYGKSGEKQIYRHYRNLRIEADWHAQKWLEEDRRTVQGLATPHRKVSTVTNRSLSPRPPEPLGNPPDEYNLSLGPQDVSELQSITCSSSTHSLSTNSYQSAVASQEDMTLVDLHMQLNRHIVDSPLLMSSYVGHLSSARCPNWAGSQQTVAPLFQREGGETDNLVYVGGRFVPQMEIISEGFTMMKMVTGSPAGNSVWDTYDSDIQDSDLGLGDEDIQFSRADDLETNRTAVIFRLQGSIDVAATPLLLECLQRYIDALTPTLGSLHPLSVISNLHSSCVSQVESQNVLKKDELVIQKIFSKTNSMYEEYIKTQIQMAFYVPKINITLLQASIVEEIISFSALDNIKDLTCVSFFAVCFENITAKFHRGKKSREMLQIFQRPAVLSAGGKKKVQKSFLGSNQVSMSETVAKESVYIETSEKHQEETVVSLYVGRVHAQLRRLRNDSSILNDAIITAIPSHHSKVLFTCQKISQPSRGIEFYLNSNIGVGNAEEDSEDKLGFIMFECGLEGVAIKVVKRSLFEKVENQDEKVHLDSDLYCAESLRSHDVESVDRPSSEISGAATHGGTHQGSTSGPDSTQGGQGTSGTQANVIAVKDNNGNTSSCVLELKSVWFNFAAPPRAPITRKLDYTRLDWNLLSTASPAINAWMNPSNRFAMRLLHSIRSTYHRTSSVVACLMALGLEQQVSHTSSRSLPTRLTTLARTLAEDASCQLCNRLERFLVELEDIASVEAQLQMPDRPPLVVLRQGVIVLARQWKNILYTPLLLEHNYKSSVRPVNVTFAVPDLEEEICLTDGEASGNDDPDVTDECAMLLRTEGLRPKGGPIGNLSVNSGPLPPVNSPRADVAPATSTAPSNGAVQAVAVVSSGIESVLTSPSPPVVPQRKNRRGLPQGVPPVSSRASAIFPTQGFGARAPDGIAPGSDPSVNSQSSPDLPGSPANHGPTKANHSGGPHLNQSASCEDLYSWMAKQQEYVRSQQQNIQNIAGGVSNVSTGAPQRKEVEMMQREMNIGPDSKVNTLATDSSGEYGANAFVAGVNLYPMQDSLRLLDAHMIFQPLLSSLGVMPHQMLTPNPPNSAGGPTGSSLDSLGSNLSLVGSMEQMRIDIVVSECGKGGKLKQPSQNLHLDLVSDETPAFICERVSIELEVDKMADMTVDDMIRTRNVLYISRGQLKKHTSTALNFSIAVRQISQQVNMPLLRLLHQITNMYQNVKETQNELKEQRPQNRPETPPQVPKNTSSSASDLQDTTLIENKLSMKISDPSSIVSGSIPQKTLSPSASVRSRPQSFAQKLRQTGKSVKGYINLNEGGTFTHSPSISGVSEPLPPGNCWKTVYHLLDLYATMPETKTITHRFSMGGDISEYYKGNRKYDILMEAKSVEDVENGQVLGGSTPLPPKDFIGGERTRLIVFGVARIHKTKLLATLSGLKLEAEIASLHSSLTWRKKSKPVSLEFSLTGQIGRTMIVLLEGVPPNIQTVVKITVGKSQALYSSVSRKNKDKNSGLLTVGAVAIDIPQHPVALHGMVTRGSKQLSSTLQELRVTRTSSRMMSKIQTDHSGDENIHNRENLNSPNHSQNPPSHNYSNLEQNLPPKSQMSGGKSLLEPLVMQFSVIIQSLSISAALLPSLQAQYKMDQVNSVGVTGNRAKFTIDLPHHSLSFTTKMFPKHLEPTLPSEASIGLPAIHVTAEYIPENSPNVQSFPPNVSGPSENIILKKGGYLSANADIGVFEHSLTTDLLNHLVFVQKVFMREVNEVVQKVYGGERPVRLWEDQQTIEERGALNKILFSLVIRIQRIQLTATTAGSSAVRLETGVAALELSNRVQNLSGGESVRLFGKAQVDINLCLGQLTRNAMFEEAEPDFQQFAFFNTRVGLRNAFQDEIMDDENKEVVLITLKRPLVYIQPLAVDKAILVWLNYKNAYDYWTEKRANLNKEVLTATQQVFEKVPFGQFTNAVGPNLGTLFLQLTVDDMGLCLPLNPLPTPFSRFFDDSHPAVVVTLESTSISACSSNSLVSKGRFSNLCLRFADDFDPSLDDWKPELSDSGTMNLCVVTEGTYEVCSRTIVGRKEGDKEENAKWLLNVSWQMEGVDINLDTNVGKQLGSLGHTLTMLTGIEDGPSRSLDDSDELPVDKTSQESITPSSGLVNLPNFVLDPSLDSKKRSKLIEKEMNEQAKIINDLRSLGASHGTIQQELRRLHELETLVYKDFRKEMIQKLRRQSVKASSIKGKLGLGSKSSAYRSKSFIIPSPTPERQVDIPESPENGCGSFESSPRSGPSRTASLKGRMSPRKERDSIYTHKSIMSPQKEVLSPERVRERGVISPPKRVNFSESETSLDTIEVDGEKVEIRKKNQEKNFEPPLFGGKMSTEPNIDFELDVKVLINSGKCVLHTKDGEQIKMRKDRSCSAGLLEFPPNSSPDTSRRNKEKSKESKEPRKGSNLQQPHPNQLIDLTIFHIPGMDVKLHYESKVDTPNMIGDANLEGGNPQTPTFGYEAEETREGNINLDKEYTPHVGIDNPNYYSELGENKKLKKGGTKKAALFVWMTLQSIPEETIISPHILEFLEQALEPIPSKAPHVNISNFTSDSVPASSELGGNYVYTSFPVDVIVYFHMAPSTFRFSCLPVSRVECMLQLPSLDIVFSSKRAEETETFFSVGGLSVTGCLADFSVYIFHPYGGKKLKEQFSPLSDSERKDSLSINVEFVKFHLSRSKKLNFDKDLQNFGAEASSFASNYAKDINSRAVIRFSTIVDIGSASFKYDMRRLTEILAFPKAWYRRSIVRRLFLGDLSVPTDDEMQEFPTELPTEVPITSPLSKNKLKLNLDNTSKSSSQQSTDSSSPQKVFEDSSTNSWETLVLFAVNFQKLNVHMNMGNVMGNVCLQTKNFRSEGRLNIGSTGFKNMFLGLGLQGSSLDAKGGIVGGIIEIADIDTYIHIREEKFSEPDHKVGVKLQALELRLDYMGISILMGRVSALNVTVKDEWTLNSKFLPTRPAASVFLHGFLSWDQLQLIISKSSTCDLLKMYHKLEEFFSQQFNSSKRVFSRLGPSKPNTVYRKLPSQNSNQFEEAKHHRHWQHSLKLISGLKLSSLKLPLPKMGVVLGGTVECRGQNISLACFHGINFKSKSWALFSMKEPSINFNTEAQEIPSSPQTQSGCDVHVVQTLTCSLGYGTYKTQHSMATICKVSRNLIFPPQFKSLQEWFHYAFASSHLDEVDRFPSLEHPRPDLKLTDPNHTREIIFALPSLQLHLKTEHLQTASTPDLGLEKPTVECSFITEFEDHIFVTVDAEAFFFLHDLITSYVKEKEKVFTPSTSARASSPDPERVRTSPSPSGREDIKKGPPGPQNAFNPEDMFTKDWRNYQCKTWHMEPTVRLLSWAGKSIEPYGIDYILQKLGFSHARTTIPKWMQRGFMDPLDKVLAVLTLKMVALIKDEKNESTKK